MNKKTVFNNYCYDEEGRMVKSPYWLVMYLDYDGSKHLTAINDQEYFSFIKENYVVLFIKTIKN